jgi:hypothetical protein
MLMVGANLHGRWWLGIWVGRVMVDHTHGIKNGIVLQEDKRMGVYGCVLVVIDQ